MAINNQARPNRSLKSLPKRATERTSKSGEIAPNAINKSSVVRPHDIKTYEDIPQSERDKAILLEAGTKFYKGGAEASEKFLSKYNIPYTIDYENSTYQGLIAIHNETNNAKVVFRGTEKTSPSDITYDIGLITGYEGSHPQQEDAKDLMKLATENYVVDECLGFSKGGANCIQNAGKYNIPSTLFNPAITPNIIKQTSIIGSPESDHNSTSYWDWINPIKIVQNSLGGQMYSLFNKYREGGYGDTPITIYRTPYDVVSQGSSAFNSYTHPHISIHTIPTRDAEHHSQSPNFHMLTNFFDKVKDDE